MGDFHQAEKIATLHRLNRNNLPQLEEELNEYTKTRPISLVLPCLYSELERQALRDILEKLKDVT